MKKTEENKLQQLLVYYARNGFNHTVEEIAEALQVTPKTLFNRYQSKEKMEHDAFLYWQQQMCAHIVRSCVQANNAVEQLLFFIGAVSHARKSAPPLFERKLQELLGDFTEADVLQNLLERITETGIHDHTLREESNYRIFARFFEINTFLLAQHNALNPDTVEFLLYSVLTDFGRMALGDVNVESLLASKKSAHLPF